MRRERRCSRSFLGLLERLIDPEVRDLQTQRVDPHELVRHVLAEHEVHLRDVRFSPALIPRARRVEQFLKAH